MGLKQLSSQPGHPACPSAAALPARGPPAPRRCRARTSCGPGPVRRGPPPPAWHARPGAPLLGLPAVGGGMHEPERGGRGLKGRTTAAHLSCSAACMPFRTARACGVNDGGPTSTPTPALRAAPCRRPAPPQPRPSAGLLPPRGRRPAPGWARLQGGAGGGGGVPHSRASWDAETMCQAAHMEPGHARQGQVDVRVPAQNPALWLCVVSSPL